MNDALLKNIRLQDQDPITLRENEPNRFFKAADIMTEARIKFNGTSNSSTGTAWNIGAYKFRIGPVR